MKDLIKKILREETEEKVLSIPGLQYFGDMESTEERLETWNRVLSYVGDRKFKIKGDLNLAGTSIKSLGNLQSVGGYFNLVGTSIQSLGNLQSVGGNLNLIKTPIQSLGNLQSVGGGLYLGGTLIKSLGDLQSVGGNLNLIKTPIQSLGNLQSVGGGLNLNGTPISRKYSEEEIKQMFNVGGNIYMLQ